MDTEKAKRFIIELTGLYADIVCGVFDAKKYERLKREYADVDRFDIMREMAALTDVPIDGRKWRRIRKKIDTKGARYKALLERSVRDGV
ncbi:hypothetical protein AB4Z21_28355 [Paenibacillus sp. MCAF20]